MLGKGLVLVLFTGDKTNQCSVFGDEHMDLVSRQAGTGTKPLEVRGQSWSQASDAPF